MSLVHRLEAAGAARDALRPRRRRPFAAGAGLPARPTQEQISYAVGYASFWIGLGALCAVLQLTFIFTRRWSRLLFTLIISGAGVLGQKSIPFAPAVMFVLAVRKPARTYLERVAEAPGAPAV